MFWRMTAVWVLAGLLTTGFSSAHGATIVTDQVNDVFLTDSSKGSGFSLSRSPWRQEILAGVTGQLVGLDVFVNGPGPIDVTVNVGAPVQTDPNDFATSFAGIASTLTTHHLDLTSANIFLSSGQAFTLSIAGRGTGFPITDLAAGTRGLSAGGFYAGRFFNGSVLFDQSNGGRYDLGFRTYMRLPDPPEAVTPEPTSLALAGFAGLGMAIGAWRRRAKQLAA